MIPTQQQFKQMQMYRDALADYRPKNGCSKAKVRITKELSKVIYWLGINSEYNTTTLLDEEPIVGNFEFIKQIKKQSKKTHNENSYIRRRSANSKKPR